MGIHHRLFRSPESLSLSCVCVYLSACEDHRPLSASLLLHASLEGLQAKVCRGVLAQSKDLGEGVCVLRWVLVCSCVRTLPSEAPLRMTSWCGDLSRVTPKLGLHVLPPPRHSCVRVCWEERGSGVQGKGRACQAERCLAGSKEPTSWRSTFDSLYLPPWVGAALEI